MDKITKSIVAIAAVCLIMFASFGIYNLGFQNGVTSSAKSKSEIVTVIQESEIAKKAETFWEKLKFWG